MNRGRPFRRAQADQRRRRRRVRARVLAAVRMALGAALALLLALPGLRAQEGGGRGSRQGGAAGGAGPAVGATAPRVAKGLPRSLRPQALAGRVEIRRTAYGVPHILAEDLAAAAFGLAYCQLEDYGIEVVRRLIEGRGEAAKYFGRGELEGDFARRLAYARAVETYRLLDRDTRDVMEGFAAGVNHYIALHPGEFPEWVKPDFTAYDVAARDVGGANWGAARAFLGRMGVAARASALPGGAGEGGNGGPVARASGAGSEGAWDSIQFAEDGGSNAWAFAPARTKSGRAILLRNPHLAWTAGYYEAHLTVPGKLNFYGDFRIGGPFGIIGGFNEVLGWSTTNNDPDLDVIYELAADPERPHHYRWDGAAVPLRREEITVEVLDGENGLVRETRELWFSAIGPVIHGAGDRIYAIKSADDGEYRRGQQFLRMMQARSLEEWKDAMRMRIIAASNFTYADRDGNIFYVWNAKLPSLPHPPDRGAAVPAHGARDVWTELVPFDELPQLLNPPGGYVQNANDPPYFTNLRAVLDRSRFPANFPEPRLRLRTQHSLQLVDTDERLSLEDVIALKHSLRADFVIVFLNCVPRLSLLRSGAAPPPA